MTTLPVPKIEMVKWNIILVNVLKTNKMPAVAQRQERVGGKAYDLGRIFGEPVCARHSTRHWGTLG